MSLGVSVSQNPLLTLTLFGNIDFVSFFPHRCSPLPSLIILRNCNKLKMEGNPEEAESRITLL